MKIFLKKKTQHNLSCVCAEGGLIAPVIQGVGWLGTPRSHWASQLAAVAWGWDTANHHPQASLGQPATHLHPLYPEQWILLHPHPAQEQIPEEWGRQCSLRPSLPPPHCWRRYAGESRANESITASVPTLVNYCVIPSVTKMSICRCWQCINSFKKRERGRERFCCSVLK